MAEVLKKGDLWYRDDDISTLEIYNIETGEREVVYDFDYLIEAPNWSPDSKKFAFVSYRIKED